MKGTSSGLILAGGLSRRMGRDKAMLVIDGQTLLARTVQVLSMVVGEILVVGRRHLPVFECSVESVPDDVPQVGPLGGLHAGLSRITSPYAVTVACDLPFLNPSLLRYLLQLAAGYDAVVPRVDGRTQPLHAVYAREVRHVIQRQLGASKFQVECLLTALAVRWVDEDEIDSIDPSHRSFLNANTPDEWQAALHTAES
jgi:molybdopterin-guanine dinucleotide biosynthesis protein A